MLIEVKSKTNKPDGVPKKKGERSSPASNEECRGVYEVGGGVAWLLADKRADKLSARAKKARRKGAEAPADCVAEGSYWGSKFMWAARRSRRRRRNFCIEFERAKQFRFFFFFFFSLVFIFVHPFYSHRPPTFFVVSVFIRGGRVNKTKGFCS